MLEFKETRKQVNKYEYFAPSETLPPMSCTIVEKARVVVTVTADGVETKNTAAPGDALMSGPSGGSTWFGRGSLRPSTRGLRVQRSYLTNRLGA